MKSALRLAPLAFALLAALPAPLLAQNSKPAEVPSLNASSANAQTTTNRAIRAAQTEREAIDAPKFDLDFPGGTPAELVAAITKASGRPLNAIISEQYATIRIPALRLIQVDASQVFKALAEATTTTIQTPKGGMYNRKLRFASMDRPSVTDAPIWFFQVENGLPNSPTITRFFPLAYYLQSGLTVDDITTAIRTSWEISGEAKTPTIKFHQETQLLIAVGQPEQLAIIGDVLEALKTTVIVRAEAAKQAPAHGDSAH